MEFLTHVGAFIASIGIAISSFLAPTPPPEPTFAASLPSATAVFETSLAAPISSSATSLTLTANAVRGGGSISGYACFTIDEGSSQAEFVCGTVSGTSVTGLSRGVSPSTGTTTDADLQFSHRRGASVKITDFPLVQILKAQANGEDTFPNILKYTTHPTFTATTDIVDKKYVDDTAFSGAGVIDATATARGVVELATGAEAAASTASGTSGPLAIPATVATSTYNSATAANRIPVTDGTGVIDDDFIPGTIAKAISFTATTSLNRTYTSGETINGATLPVPVYASTTDASYYASDANQTFRYGFAGFAVSNATAGNALKVQTDGIVGGFSGLTAGTKYYVQDTVGTLGSTPGTMEILVGVATSATEIYILHGPRRAIGTTTFADAGNDGQASTSAVVTGFRPSIIRFTITRNGASGSSGTPQVSTGVWVNGSYVGMQAVRDSDGTPGGTGAVSSSILYYLDDGSTNDAWTITVTNVTATGFTITATQNDNTPTAIGLTWEAEGQF